MHVVVRILVKEDNEQEAIFAAEEIVEDILLIENGGPYDYFANMRQTDRYNYYNGKRGAFKLNTRVGQEELSRAWSSTISGLEEAWCTVKTEMEKNDFEDFLSSENLDLLIDMGAFGRSTKVRLYDATDPVINRVRLKEALDKDLSEVMIVPMDCHF